jgi:hypothetical protein
MQLIGILQARTLAWIDIFELNPAGRVFYPDLVREIVQQYGFQSFPKTPEQFDLQKGVEFHDGKSGDKVINKFTIFNNLITVETRLGTSGSSEVIGEILQWGKGRFELNYRPEMIKWAFVSELAFRSDLALIKACSSPLERLAQKTGDAVSKIWGEKIHYEPAVVSAAHDPRTRKYGIANVSIQYLPEHPFSDNKYYSLAPLPTDMHVQFLQEFEADAKRQAATMDPIPQG